MAVILLIALLLCPLVESFAQNATNHKVAQYLEQSESEFNVANFQDALYWAKKARKLDTSEIVFYHKAKAELLLNELDSAAADFDRTDSLNSIDKFFYLGLLAYKQKDYTLAVSYLENFLGNFPKNEVALNYLAESYRSLEDFQKAVEIYNQAILLNPDAELYLGRAQAKLENLDFLGALNDASKSLELQPLNPEALIIRAKAKFPLEDYQGLVADLKKALQMLPQGYFLDPKEYSLMAFAYWQLKDQAQAMFWVDKAITLDSLNAEWYYEKAGYLMEENKFEEALVLTHKAVEKDPEDLAYVQRRAQLYLNTEQWALLLQDSTLLARLDPENAETIYWRALARYHLQQSPREVRPEVELAQQLGYPKDQMVPELQKYLEPRALGRKNSRKN